MEIGSEQLIFPNHFLEIIRVQNLDSLETVANLRFSYEEFTVIYRMILEVVVSNPALKIYV